MVLMRATNLKRPVLLVYQTRSGWYSGVFNTLSDAQTYLDAVKQKTIVKRAYFYSTKRVMRVLARARPYYKSRGSQYVVRRD